MEMKDFIKFSKVLTNWAIECNFEQEFSHKIVGELIEDTEKLFFEKTLVNPECSMECIINERKIILTYSNIKDNTFFYIRAMISFVKDKGISLSYLNPDGEESIDFDKMLLIKKVEDIKKENIN